jgi:hypothetical protein
MLVAENCLVDLLLDQLRASDIDLPHHNADHAPTMHQVVLRGTRTHVVAHHLAGPAFKAEGAGWRGKEK